MPAKAHKAAGARLCRAFALALIALPAWGATWYVRPAEGTYGTSDGTSYANAFDGFADITWGVGQVNTGDTLYVCGSFDTTSSDGTGAFQAMLLIEAAGVIIDGNCSAQGDLPRAVLDGETTQDFGIYCVTTALCLNTAIRNISIRQFDRRGVYIRNDLSLTNLVNATIENVDCSDVIGPEADVPQCISGFGDGGIMRNIVATRASDDLIHWEGDNVLLENWRGEQPGYLASSNLGDCLQVAGQADNARVRRGYCDHRNNATKQCVIIQGDAADDNAEISDVTCLYPLAGNEVYLTKALFTGVANTIFRRNFIVGAHYGIWVEIAASSSIVESNILIGQQQRGINLVSTLAGAGLHRVANNSVTGSGEFCAEFNGGASVSMEVRNNAFANCGVAAVSKGPSPTVTATHNAFWNSPINCTGLTCTSSITADPQFIGGANPTTAEGFRLSASSPLAAAGTDLGDEIADYFGDYMYNGKWDIGAFRRDSCYRRSRDGKLDMARTRAQVVSRCRGMPPRYPEGL